MTYPVQGYRTPRARSFNPPAGFQGPGKIVRPPSFVGRPANVNIPAQTRWAREVARQAARGGLIALARRHPALVAARVAQQLAPDLLPLWGPDVVPARQASYYNPTGRWQNCQMCEAGTWPDRQFTGHSTECITFTCNAGQLVSAAGPAGEIVPAGHSYVAFMKHIPGTPFGANYHRHVSVWWRPTSSDALAPPSFVPAADPMPIPAAFPQRLPYRVAAAKYRANGLVRDAGPAPAGRPAAGASPTPPVRHRPPGRGVKERKFRLMAGGTVRRILEWGFRVHEAIEIAHQALPRWAQAGSNATGLQMLHAVYKHAGQLDGSKLVLGILDNIFEDAIGGLLGKAAKAEAQAVGRAYGLSGLAKKLDGPGFPSITEALGLRDGTYNPDNDRFDVWR